MNTRNDIVYHNLSSTDVNPKGGKWYLQFKPKDKMAKSRNELNRSAQRWNYLISLILLTTEFSPIATLVYISVGADRMSQQVQGNVKLTISQRQFMANKRLLLRAKTPRIFTVSSWDFNKFLAQSETNFSKHSLNWDNRNRPVVYIVR